MQKKILPVLAFLCAFLLVANLVFLVLIFQRTFQKSSGPQAVLPVPAAAAVRDDSAARTIGTQAGEAVADLQEKSGKTYDDLSVQAKKTTDELNKTTGEAAKVLNQQFEKTMKELESFSDEMLAALQRELEKFQEAIKKKQTP